MTSKIPGYYKPYKNIGWCTLAESICVQGEYHNCHACPIPMLSRVEGEIDESRMFYRCNGSSGRCELTGLICDKGIVACRSCLVPFYMWMLENEVRE